MDNTIAIATMDEAVNSDIKPPQTSSHVTQPESCLKIGDASSVDSTAVSTKSATKNLWKCFQVLGFKMPQRHRKAYMVYSFLLNSLVTIFLPMAFIISFFGLDYSSMGKTEISIFLISYQVFFALLICELKLLALTLTRNKWGSVDEVMERLDRRCRQSDQEIAELRQCVRQGNRSVICFFAAYFIYVMCTVLDAFFHGRTPYSLYLPFLDQRRSRSQFLISMFVEIFLTSVACVQQAFNDSFAIAHVCILRSHMRALLLRFANLTNATMGSDNNLVELKQCIRDHKNYLELYNIIASVISVTIFIQFVFTAVMLSTTFFNIMLFTTDLYSRMCSCLLVFSILVEVVPICYYAQCLMDESNLLPMVIFHSDWIDQDVRYRKMLVFLQQRTQCTTDLMAGKLFPINLNFCLSILKFSFTLYTFITAMGLEKKFENL